MARQPSFNANSTEVLDADGLTRPAVALFGEVLADVFPDRQVLGGAPFNVARHLQAFGVHAVLISRVGDDALHARIVDAMQRYGMDVSGIQFDHQHPTGQVQVRMQPDGRHSFEILPNQAYDFINASIARMVTLALKPDLVYFGTLAQRHPVSRRALNTLLRGSRALRMLDLNLRAPWYEPHILRQSLQRADVLKINDEELREMAGILQLRGSDARQQAMQLMRMFELRRIVVTCGGEGAWQLFMGADEASFHRVGAPAAEVMDTVGAGDGFSSVLILGELCDWPVDLTMARASAFAAAICGLRGAVPESPDFYRPFLREWQSGGKAGR